MAPKFFRLIRCQADIHNLNLGGSLRVSKFDLELMLFQTAKPGFHQANYDHDNDQFRVKTKRLA